MKGKCFFCKKEIDNRVAVRHIKGCKERLEKRREYLENSKEKKTQFTIKLNDKYKKDYFIYLSIDADATLADLDMVIREVWVECCGHLSEFIIDGIRYIDTEFIDEMSGEDINIRLDEILYPDGKFLYLYDFGSTTYIEGKVIERYETGSEAPEIEILARNNKIGKFNSPREGICGYSGRDEEVFLPANNIELLKGRDESVFDDTECDLDYDDIEEDDIDANDIESYLFDMMFKEMEKEMKKGLKRAAKRNENFTVQEMIESYTVPEIKEILNDLGIEYRSGCKKAELVKIYLLSYKEAYVEFLNSLSEEAYKELIYLKNNNGSIFLEGNSLDYGQALIRVAFLNLVADKNGDIKLNICKELIPLIDKVKKENIEKNQEIIKWVYGIINYYGCVDVISFVKKFAKETNSNFDMEYMMKIIKVILIESFSSKELDYEDGSIQNSVFDREKRTQILKGCFEYKVLTKRDIEKSYKLINPNDNKVFDEVKEVLRENFDLEEIIVEGELRHFYYVYQLEGLEELFDYIDSKFEVDWNEMLIFRDIVKRAMFKVPCWRFGGYSENEVNNRKQTTIERVKIGRNEPCSCGSGKKYKKCCGAKVIEVDFRNR